MFGYPQPISILIDNTTLTLWFSRQGRLLENVSRVETIDINGLHIWVYFSNEPDVVAYRHFPELNHQIFPPIKDAITVPYSEWKKYSHYRGIRLYFSSYEEPQLQGLDGKIWVKAKSRSDVYHG